LSGSAFGFPNVRKIEREYVFSRYFPARMSRFSISPRQNARRDFLRPDSCVRTVTVGKAVAVCELLKKFGNLQKSDYLATVESPPKGFEELKTTDFRMPDGERHIEFNY
jgi:hypothetical protein